MTFDEIDNRKKVLILIPTAIVLLLLVFFVFKLLASKRNERLNDKPSNQELNIQALKNYDIINNAIKKKDAKICDQLSGEAKASCLYVLAVSSRNQEICKEIASQAEQNNCLAFFDFQTASQSGNYQKCLTFTQINLKNSCLAEVFRKTKDFKSCSSLPKDISAICADYYYLNTAYKNKDKKNCDKIVDKSLKMNCQIVLGS